VLGIVLEFGDVTGTIRCLQQVRLRAAPKWAQVLDGGDASSHRHLLRVTMDGSMEGETDVELCRDWSEHGKLASS